MVTVSGTGRRTLFHSRGANSLLGPQPFVVDQLPCKTLKLGSLLLLDTLGAEDPDFGTGAARVLSQLREAGIVTVIDLASEDADRFARVVTPALPHADYIIVNEIEAGKITGREVRRGDRLDRTAMEAAAIELVALGVKRGAIVHAPELSLAASPGQPTVWQPSHDLPHGFVEGAAGAGDAFEAGILVGIHENWDPARSLRFANAAGACALSDVSTTGSVGTADEIWSVATTLPLKSLDTTGL